MNSNRKIAVSVSLDPKQVERLEEISHRHPSPRWHRSLSSYPKAELRAVRFRAVKEIDRAIELCWHDPDLLGVPRAIADGKTLIVPNEAVKYFKDQGLKFTVSTLLNREELTTAERAAMRRKYGM